MKYIIVVVLFLVSPLSSMNNIEFTQNSTPDLSDITLNYQDFKKEHSIAFRNYDLDLYSEFLLSQKFSCWRDDYKITELIFDHCHMNENFGFSFAGKLQHLKKIKITDCGLKAEHLDDLFKFLEYISLNEVDFSNNVLNGDDIISPLELANVKCSINTLNLSGNNIPEKLKTNLKEVLSISNLILD